MEISSRRFIIDNTDTATSELSTGSLLQLLESGMFILSGI